MCYNSEAKKKWKIEVERQYGNSYKNNIFIDKLNFGSTAYYG